MAFQSALTKMGGKQPFLGQILQKKKQKMTQKARYNWTGWLIRRSCGVFLINF
jgi:hypothetical protein